MWHNFYDWMWVFVAFFLGKVLRKKKYRPLSLLGIFMEPIPTTGRKLQRLAYLWGVEVFTVQDATKACPPRIDFSNQANDIFFLDQADDIFEYDSPDQ